MVEGNLNEVLMKAVEYHRVNEVRELLAKGANPNYFHRWEDNTDTEGQPNTPLRMVVFCISDNLLEDEDLKEFAEVAKLLLQHGADPKPAMQLAEKRYGRYRHDTPPSLFLDVLNIVDGRA